MIRFKEYDGIDFATVSNDLADVEGFAPLHRVRKRKLALLLIESRLHFDIRRGPETTVAPSATASEIRGILGSLSRIAEFARKAKSEKHPATQDAMFRIFGAAEHWAEQNRHNLPANFRPSPYLSDIGPQVDYGSTDALTRFFVAAPTVYEIANHAERAMASLAREDAPQSAIAWLAGAKLPEIYSRIFQTKFTTTRGQNRGIAFVQSALRAIKVRRSISDETILSHFKAARG
jgi:hypothetical protein